MPESTIRAERGTNRLRPFMLQRYVLAEMLLNLVFSLVVITSVFFIALVLQAAYRYQDLPMGTILTMIPFFLPYSLIFTVPFSALIATVQTFGRLSSDNEITAIRIGGIHLYHLLTPALFLGLAMSLVSYYLSATLVPECILKSDHITRTSLDEVLTRMRTGRHELFLQRRTMTFVAEEDGTFSDILIVEPDPQGPGNRKIMARSASISVDRATEMLRFHLRDGTMTTEAGTLNFEQNEFGLTLSDRQRLMRHRLKECKMGELFYRLERPDLEEGRLKVETEIHRRITMSFASFFFALIGTPMGILIRRGGRMTAFIISFLVIVLVYFPLVVLGEALGIEGKLPPVVSMWIANGIIGGAGVVLAMRMFRE